MPGTVRPDPSTLGMVGVGHAASVEQAAERLGTSVRFVRRLVAERRITAVKLGRHVRIAARDLDAFVAAGRVEPGSRLGARWAAAGSEHAPTAVWPLAGPVAAGRLKVLTAG